MWFEMRKEDLGFTERAPLVHVVEADATAPRSRVFAAFAEPQTWRDWFPNVREASYASPPPYGVGTIRQAHVGGTHWLEEMIVWDEDKTLGWTVRRASVPFAKAQVEVFDFTDAANGTRARWTLAIEPRLLALLGAPFARRVVTRLFRRAIQSLDAYLAAQSVGPEHTLPRQKT